VCSVSCRSCSHAVMQPITDYRLLITDFPVPCALRPSSPLPLSRPSVVAESSLSFDRPLLLRFKVPGSGFKVQSSKVKCLFTFTFLLLPFYFSLRYGIGDQYKHLRLSRILSMLSLFLKNSLTINPGKQKIQEPASQFFKRI
jgi:hypothetical protein